MNLYDLAKNYAALAERLNDPDADNEVVIAELDKVTDAFDTKAINVGRIIKNHEAMAAAIKAEEQRLAARRQRLEKSADWLKTYLLQQMQAIGIQKVNDPLLPLARRKNPPAVQVLDEALVPDLYFEETITRRLDRKRIAEAIKAGATVPGATLEQSERVVVG